MAMSEMEPEADKGATGGRARAAMRAGVTLAIIAGAAAAVLGGRSLIAERAAASTAPAAQIETVRVARLAMQEGYALPRAFTGVLEPAQRTSLAFEFGGTIEQVLVSEGERVLKGAPLARLDTRLLRAEEERLFASRAALEAQAELARRTASRQGALHERGFASTQALDGATLGLLEIEARMAEIDAGLAGVAIRLEKSVLRAPFDGVVSQRALDDGAPAGPGQPVATLVETQAPQFRVGLPPEAVAALPADGRVTVTARGRDYPARLVAVLPELDPATRTRAALFRLDAAEAPVFREIASVSLVQSVEARGAWAPLSAVEPGPRGLWRVFTAVDEGEGPVVRAQSVEIVHAEAERVYLRGPLAEGEAFIVDGLHRVTPGQRVRLVGEEG